MSTIIIEDFRPMPRNSLRGFARVRLPSGMILHDVSIHFRDGRGWASPPDRPAVGKDGTQIKKDGKPLYNPVLTFADRETGDKFSAAVLEAVRLAYPDVIA